MKKGLFSSERAITDLGGGLASTLAFKAMIAIAAEIRDRACKSGYLFGGGQDGKRLNQQVPQDRIAVIAGSQVTQRVNGIISPVGAC